MIITKTNWVNGKSNSMTIPLTEDEYYDGLGKMDNGALIQNAFPTLLAGEREFLMTGITPELWDSMFGEDDHEDDLGDID
jgi:hypothetical protein